MTRFGRWAMLLTLLAGVGGAAEARIQPRARVPLLTDYAELADRTLGAPVILTGTVDSVDRVDPKRAPDAKPGTRRFLIRLAVSEALKAPGAVPQRVRFLWDTAEEGRPDLLKRDVIAFLSPSSLEDYRLTRPDGLIADRDEAVGIVRAVLKEARSPDLQRRRVTGVQSATHTAGTVPGEGETQIFLSTAGGDPISLIVLSRPGQPRTLSAAFGDAIDEAASPVKSGTLAWFYLACGLPRTLPDTATADLAPEDVAAARSDYGFALDAVGTCTLRR